MPQSLVIVESPAKVKTLTKFLGGEYLVKASVGHVRDLPKSKLGVDIENNYSPQYKENADKASVIKDLKSAAKKAGSVLLATDPDREGEAIAWHLSEMLGLDKGDAVRIQFNEITERAVKDAIGSPRPIDMGLVDAQQARRVLDRLVGYKLSPFLWKKVRTNLSAGRVQSVALRLICDREAEIEAFTPVEFWTIEATLAKIGGTSFKAKYIKGRTNRVESGTLAALIVEDCKRDGFTVKSVEVKESSRRPSAPFITSSLQQESYRKLGLTARTTMSIAQQLYEGVEIKGKGQVALITYMRTDSYRISEEARKAAKGFIAHRFGKEYLPTKDRIYAAKADAQDAHEAIRPVNPDLEPDAIKDNLSRDQLRLYRLIWNRFLASQMADMRIETTTVTASSSVHDFRAQGTKVKFEGFSAVYGGSSASEDQDAEASQKLPLLSEGERLDLLEITPSQNFTEPPPRYSEGTLVKALEEKGVGRPSTYAAIIDTIKKRDYVDIKDRTFVPTSIGKAVCEVLKANFEDIVNVDFTAAMESKLDSIEGKGLDWTSVIDEFYKPFIAKLGDAEQNQQRVKIEVQMLDEACPECGKPLVVRRGRFGPFTGCSGYPECKYIKKKEKVILDYKCPLCQSPIEEKMTRFKRKVYSCTAYPNCKFSVWKKPEDVKCEACGSFTVAYGRGKAKQYRCPNPTCVKYIDPKEGKKEESEQ